MIIDRVLPESIYQEILSDNSLSNMSLWQDATIYRRESRKDRSILDPTTRKSSIMMPRGSAWNSLELHLDRNLRNEIQCFFGIPLGKLTEIQLLRYPVGGYFKAHRDRGGPFPNSLFTIVGSVVQAERGGELCIFEPAERIISLYAKRLVVFPADALHASLPVVAGVKVVFVAWFLENSHT